MLLVKMISRCMLYYDKIDQINFLTDLLIKASKFPNFEAKYIGQFWAQRSESFCVIFVNKQLLKKKKKIIGMWGQCKNLDFVIFY